jgi:hypothetical protein
LHVSRACRVSHMSDIGGLLDVRLCRVVLGWMGYLPRIAIGLEPYMK